MDFFEIPDDYKPQKPLTMEEMDENTNYLKNHPLFMKEMPEDISSNEHLMILQSFKEDQDPLIQAENLNKQANKRLQQGPNSHYYMKDAYQKYTQAIKIKCSSEELNAKLHANRAAINLKYKNYGKVVEDCKIALKYIPTYLKAFYRMGKAYIAMNKYNQCIELLKDEKDNDIIAIRKEAEQLKQKQSQEAQKLQEKKNSYSAQVESYFNDRKWKLGKTNEQLPSGVEIQFFDGNISIPILVIYPEFNQFDLIAKTSQNQRIGDCIQQLFENPLPWDAKGQYTFNKLELYLEIEEAVLLRLPSQATISQLAKRKAVNGAIELIILSPNQFSSHFKQQYKIY